MTVCKCDRSLVSRASTLDASIEAIALEPLSAECFLDRVPYYIKKCNNISCVYLRRISRDIIS
ncbi:hypothetical protein CKA32_005855 [Geitlerinema sp. FC II]|nr:hypothetical protein CKA32_005855 [Geitlerinema sp. FC II]